MFNMTLFSPSYTPQNTPVKCETKQYDLIEGCGWEGTLSECVREYFKSDFRSWAHLAGREENYFNCPKCNKTIYTEILRIS